LHRVKEGEEHKLASRTRYWLFERTVMEFGTTIAPTDFQGNTTNATREALDDFASGCLDNILIYGNSEEEHEGHVKWIMQRLLDAELYLKPEKCEIPKDTVKYLGLIISIDGISMDKDKVETVQHWSREKKTATGK